MAPTRGLIDGWPAADCTGLGFVRYIDSMPQPVGCDVRPCALCCFCCGGDGATEELHPLSQRVIVLLQPFKADCQL